ncbi:dynamin family protein [Flavobacterium piscisymbiosum]|uniref:Dynamin family protein n=1 Tax=Flavobacterium piscisymbiosum TaxID=2893753 RepID=A0ABS8MFZ1_9FLAO|nr:dynamin family protein [Flavobacterium sp. F-30]MCC9063605.1 dynamin family protein [Flavobacterium sp. F-30]
MQSNIFQDIQDKTNQLKKYVQHALDSNWINVEKFNEVIQKVENDKLTIGVIGQMKCGKSTFLNALIFQDEVLPAATTPMTASLCIITYGEEKSLDIEFFTTNEWDDLKYQASRSLEDVKSDENLVSKIKAAKEIISKSITIEHEINSLLGTKKKDDLANLIQYVGANGKYIAITKSVKIYYPLDYLKGVEIVDTPGFNDPVVSREERTKDFLSKADVVVMLLSAARPFDRSDKDIIYNKIRTIGMGKILIGVNKYDLSYEQGETPNQIISYVKAELLKASEEFKNSFIGELVNEHAPLLISTNMALMSKLPISRITQNENLKHYYDKALGVFEISSQAEMFEKSLMKEFEKAVKDIILKSKDEILLNKAKNQIKEIGSNRNDELVKEIGEVANVIKILETPNEELPELQKSAQKVKRRINRKIDNLEVDITEILLKNIKKVANETEDSLAASKKRCYRIIDDATAFSSEDAIYHKFNAEFESLDRKTKRDFENFNDEINSSIKKEINNFLYEIKEIVDDYVEDFDIKEYFGKIKKELLQDLVSIQIVDLITKYDNLTVKERDSLIKELGTAVLIGALAIPIMVTDLFNFKSDLRELVSDNYSLFDLGRISLNVKGNGEELINNVKKMFLDDFINPIEQQIDDVINNTTNRENDLKINKEKLENLKSAKSLIESQIKQMKELESYL